MVEINHSSLFSGICTNIASSYKIITIQFEPRTFWSHSIGRYCLKSSERVWVVRLPIIWIIWSWRIGGQCSSNSFWNRRWRWQVRTLRMETIFISCILDSDGSSIWRRIRVSALDNLENQCILNYNTFVTFNLQVNKPVAYATYQPSYKITSWYFLRSKSLF